MHQTRIAAPRQLDARSALLAAAADEFQSVRCPIVDEETVTRIAARARVAKHQAIHYFDTHGLQELDEYLRLRKARTIDPGRRYRDDSATGAGYRHPDHTHPTTDTGHRHPDHTHPTTDTGAEHRGDGRRSEPSLREYGSFALWRVDRAVVDWLAGRSLGLLQKSLGLIFLWFGVLKFFPGLSPAEGLVTSTINELFGLLGFGGPTKLIILALALWEVLIGLGFLFDRHRRAVTWMLIVHLPNTALPLLLLPELVWTQFPHQLTMEGQYIVKNLVLLAGGMVIGATVRGGSLISTGYVEVDDDGTPV